MRSTAMTTLFDELNNWFEASNRSRDFSSTDTSQWRPFSDIIIGDKQYEIFVDLPGTQKENINIAMDNNVLTIKGERSTEERAEDKHYVRTERFFGTFQRQFSLPDDANSENISAKLRDGVLHVTIPKKEQSISRSIKIDS